jgi:Tfp pilus assembly protein PilO
MSKPNETGQHHVPRWSEIDGAGVVAIIVLSAIFYFAALNPMMQKRDAAEAQRLLLAAQAEKATDAAAALHAAQDRLLLVQKQIAESPQKLEPVRALNNRLAGITAAATARQLDIADIRPGAAAVGLHYTTVPIAISGSGSFADCVRYLHDLHRKFGDTAVIGVRLIGNAQDATPTSALLAFHLDLRWYAAGRTTPTAP